MTPIDNILAALRQKGLQPKKDGRGWRCPCPAHGGKEANLAVGEDAQGNAVVKCWSKGCSTEEILGAINLTKVDLFNPLPGSTSPAARAPAKQYPMYDTPELCLQSLRAGELVWIWGYQDAAGTEVAAVGRFENGTVDETTGKKKKSFRPCHLVERDGKRGYTVGDPDGLWPLYNLPQILAETQSPVAPIFITEGEKAADAIIQLGLLATTSAHGSKSPHKTDWAPLDGRAVVILPDNDEPGQKYADTVAELILKVQDYLPGVVYICRLPGLPEAGDVVEWITEQWTTKPDQTNETIKAALLALVEDATCTTKRVGSNPEFTGQDESGQESAQDEAGNPDAVEVKGKAKRKPRANGASGNWPNLGERDALSGKWIFSPDRPLPTAQTYTKEYHTHADGFTLRHWQGGFWMWDANHYQMVEPSVLRARLYPFLHDALELTKNGVIRPFPAKTASVDNALDALAAEVNVPGTVVAPSWLAKAGEDAGADLCATEILPCLTYNLHLPTRAAIAATPRLFSTFALEFDPDPKAGHPGEWIKFLESVFGDDLDAIMLIQEWMGYCLTGDTSQQKMLLLIGPPRSGKGTIARVLAEIIGRSNVCGPTTSSLASEFGLQPLLGKTLAVVSDARFSGESIQTVIERLLCISGEDTITVSRKHTDSLNVKLNTRFMFLTNMAPALSDASTAISNRFLPVQITRSHLGSEDRGLLARLLGERSGILNWAIEGWHRLRLRGRFLVPQSSLELAEDIADMSSPVRAWVRDCCVQGEDYRCWIKDLYESYQSWCEVENYHVTTRQRFGRDLQSVFPGLRAHRHNDYGRFYMGITTRELLAKTEADNAKPY